MQEKFSPAVKYWDREGNIEEEESGGAGNRGSESIVIDICIHNNLSTSHLGEKKPFQNDGVYIYCDCRIFRRGRMMLDLKTPKES